mmetsp:Transcript_19560/g.42486  ORF Transcript_19560/g.42486 Transcript_19560/m.42486 type:complete len:236 (-) Transcript_19560:1911-2618(-)|eukprot:CAMPEP_0172327384 /NCGR_PEP_ID=MMETSP1058-20130122/59413_1 /TAXON_ID=83371 /ORGANISM="Detonula confervacea, Strain CCMP 353" /LENGTH=235 /DNA_ID=CAMNT_0013044421 /DNA_START=16 /DNA_END=723 /DNA_ORIENTATION=+
MTANNDSKEDGPMDRLAKRLFASPDSPFTAFADRQRMERLESCRQLERILEACQSANNDAQVSGNDSEQKSSEMTEFPPSRSGARIARFFKWDSPNSPDPNELNDVQDADSVFSDAASSFYEDSGSDGGKKQSVQSKKIIARPRFSKDCAIETHELWASRALALGCGNYLADLRRCWSDANHSPDQESVAGDGITLYNENNEKEKSCRQIQVDMAQCVKKNATELEERIQAAKKQ